jgi:hypothetical protein
MAAAAGAAYQSSCTAHVVQNFGGLLELLGLAGPSAAAKAADSGLPTTAAAAAGASGV